MNPSIDDTSETKRLVHPDEQEDYEAQFYSTRKTSFGRSFIPWTAHILLLATYTALYILATRPKASNFTTTLHPIDGIRLRPSPRPYDDFEQSPWSGLPSPKIDTAWHHLLEPTTIRVTASELARSNQSSIELPVGGGYMAWLGVFHELHCIKMIRQWVYRDYYHPNLTSDDFEELSIHADHCLDILRSAAMCHGDTTLTTFGWANKSKPMLNTRPIDHRCVDWSELMKSVEERVVGREEIGALRNPNFAD
ncbi:hypothetical protein BKA63DRAFT_92591 [Paraphoma chrysanthemicola]|nr:hypothetical protein BKA63DRAFT_92591 [Paraphoma chrysanthemicola]